MDKRDFSVKQRKKERMGMAKQRKAMQSVNYALKANKNGSGLLKKGKKENDDLLVDLLVCLVKITNAKARCVLA